MVHSSLRSSNESELAGVDSVISSRTFHGRFELLVNYEASSKKERWVDAGYLVEVARQKVVDYLIRLRRFHGRGTLTKWSVMIKKYPHLYEQVLRKRKNDPHYKSPSAIPITYENLPKPTEQDPFPKCPGRTKEDNQLNEVLGHRDRISLGFCVCFKHYHGEYWISAEVIELLEPSYLMRNYLTRLALHKYSSYETMNSRYPKFCSKFLDVPNDQDTFIPQSHYGTHVSLISHIYEGNLQDLRERGGIELVIDRGYLKKELCFLIKCYGSYRLYWLCGRKAVRLSREMILKHIVQVRRVAGYRAWNKILRCGSDYILDTVMRKQPHDEDVGLTSPSNSRIKDLDEPSRDNNYLPGCPGRTLEDNLLESVVVSEISANRLRFYVTFFNFHDGYWIHSETIKRMSHGPLIRYFANLLEHERMRVFALDRDFELLYLRQDISPPPYLIV